MNGKQCWVGYAFLPNLPLLIFCQGEGIKKRLRGEGSRSVTERFILVVSKQVFLKVFFSPEFYFFNTPAVSNPFSQLV